MRWTRLAPLAVLLVLLLTLPPFLVAIAPPKARSTVTPADLGLPFEEVTLRTEDGLALAAWFVPAARASNATILVGHGYPDDKGHALRGALFLRERYNLLLFDHRSFGASEGWVTTGGLREGADVRAALDYLRTRNDSARIGALGHSFTAGTFLLAQDPRIEALVVEGTWARLDLALEGQYRFTAGFPLTPFVWTSSLYGRLLFGAWPSEVSPVEAIRTTRAPVLLVHGTEDSKFPPEHARLLHEAAPDGLAELWLVEGAGHGGVRAKAGTEYAARVLAFFDRALAPDLLTPP